MFARHIPRSRRIFVRAGLDNLPFPPSFSQKLRISTAILSVFFAMKRKAKRFNPYFMEYM